jgi:hypothetical protein
METHLEMLGPHCKVTIDDGLNSMVYMWGSHAQSPTKATMNNLVWHS